MTAKRMNKTKRFLSILFTAVLLVATIALFSACGNKGDIQPKSISVQEDFKTSYYVGEELDPTGTLKINLDVDYFQTVPIDASMIQGFDSSKKGDCFVTVTYGELSTTVRLDIRDLAATTLALSTDSFEMYVGDPFPSDVVLTATMEDGVVVNVPVTTAMLGGFDARRTSEEPQIVTVTYGGATTSLSILVKEDVIRGISLSDEKDTFEVGDAIEQATGFVNVQYDSGKLFSVRLAPRMISGFKTDLGGEYKARVSYEIYEGVIYTCDYNYTVVKRPESLTLLKDTLPKEVEKNLPFPAGGKGILTYNDGTTEEVDLTSTLADCDTSVTGEHTATVTVSEKTDRFSYTVLPAITSAEVTGYTRWVEVGSAFNGRGKLDVVYENSESVSIPLGDERLKLTYSTDVAGDIVQSVSFRTITREFTVDVYEKEEENDISEIGVIGTFSPIKFGDAVHTAGIRIDIHYKHKNHKEISLDELLGAFDAEERAKWIGVDVPEEMTEDCEECPVYLSFAMPDGGRARYDLASVRVYSPAYWEKATGLTVFGVRAIYAVGDVLTTDGATYSAEYGDGYNKYEEGDVTAEMVTIFLYDEETETLLPAEGFEAAGTYRLKVTFEDVSTEVSCTVLSAEDAARVTSFSAEGFRSAYAVGDDVLAGLAYSAEYGDGYRYLYGEPVTAEMITILLYDGASEGWLPVEGLAEAGAYRVRVALGEFCEERDFTVISAEVAARVTALELVNAFDPILFIGDDLASEEVDLTPYVVKVTYGDGYRTEEVPLTADMFVIYDKSSASFIHKTLLEVAGKEVPLTLLYGSFAAEITAEVHPLSDLELVTGISFPVGFINTYVNVDPDLSKYDLRLTLGYGRGEMRTIPLSSVGVSITPYRKDAAGIYPVMVEYEGFSCSAAVSVSVPTGANEVRSVTLISGSRTVFTEGEDKTEALSGVRLSVRYTDVSAEWGIVTVTPNMAKDFSTEVVGGPYMIDITYEGETVQYTYAVEAKVESTEAPEAPEAPKEGNE